MLKLYISLSFFFHFFSNVFLKIRVIKGKEDPERYKEKLGCYIIKNEHKTIWFHASSLGEIKSIIPLIDYYSTKISKKILITTVTTSSAEYCKNIFNNNSQVIHQYAPIDTPQIVKKFLHHWKPDVAIFVESELWPNLIFQSKLLSKLILLNTRLSKKSFKRWAFAKTFAKKIFSQFDSISCQSQEAKMFLEHFDIYNVNYFGNLKFISHKETALSNKFIFNKSVDNTWVAMSTHEGEEEFVIQTIKNIKSKNILSQCILIPRHISRVKKITKLLNQHNFTWQLKSSKEVNESQSDIFILDTYGEAKEIFKKINIVFLGGSIIPHGGQNPLEAASEGCLIFHGPNVSNFKEIYEFLKDNKISFPIVSPEELSQELIKRFSKTFNNDDFKIIIKQKSEKILLDHINYLNSFIIKE